VSLVAVHHFRRGVLPPDSEIVGYSGFVTRKEVSFPALEGALSTGEVQAIPREERPAWAKAAPDFSGAWYSYVGGPTATSTGDLFTGNVQASVDMERMNSTPPQRRYYRFLYAKMDDGRVFQAGPFKELEYERHRDERPPWFSSYTL